VGRRRNKDLKSTRGDQSKEAHLESTTIKKKGNGGGGRVSVNSTNGEKKARGISAQRVTKQSIKSKKTPQIFEEKTKKD